VSPGAVSCEGLEQLCTLRIRRPQTFLIGRNSDMYPRRLGCTCTRGSILLGGQSQGTAPPQLNLQSPDFVEFSFLGSSLALQAMKNISGDVSVFPETKCQLINFNENTCIGGSDSTSFGRNPRQLRRDTRFRLFVHHLQRHSNEPV